MAVPSHSSTTLSDCIPFKDTTKTIQNERDMRDTAGEVRINSQTTFSDALLHIDKPVLIDEEEIKYRMPSRGHTKNNGR